MGLHVIKYPKSCKHGTLACAKSLNINTIQRLHVCKKLVTIAFYGLVKGFLVNIIENVVDKLLPRFGEILKHKIVVFGGISV